MAKKPYIEKRWTEDELEEPGGTDRVGTYLVLAVGKCSWVQVFWDEKKDELVARRWYEPFDELTGGGTKTKKKKKQSGS